MSPILTPNSLFNTSVGGLLDERYMSPKPISKEFVLSDAPRPRTRTVGLAAPNQVGRCGRVEVAGSNSQHIPTTQIVDLHSASCSVGEHALLMRCSSRDPCSRRL